MTLNLRLGVSEDLVFDDQTYIIVSPFAGDEGLGLRRSNIHHLSSSSHALSLFVLDDQTYISLRLRRSTSSLTIKHTSSLFVFGDQTYRHHRLTLHTSSLFVFDDQTYIISLRLQTYINHRLTDGRRPSPTIKHTFMNIRKCIHTSYDIHACIHRTIYVIAYIHHMNVYVNAYIHDTNVYVNAYIPHAA